MEFSSLIGVTMAAGLLLYAFSVIQLGKVYADGYGWHDANFLIGFLGTMGGIFLLAISFWESFLYIASIIIKLIPSF